MHEVLVWPLTETRLYYSTFCFQIEETNFSLFRKIFTNATAKVGNRWFFKEIDFYGHTSQNRFRRLLWVTFIFGSENHKSRDNFSFIYSISIKLNLWLSGVGFLKLSEN